MAAVDRAAHAQAVRRRATAGAPIVIARALAAEHSRHEAQARLWRWAVAGVIAGFVLLVAAVTLSPGGGSLSIAAPEPQQWYPLCGLLAVGAVWLAWRELRAG
jgi:H+/Cl- antiporter ClcA